MNATTEAIHAASRVPLRTTASTILCVTSTFCSATGALPTASCAAG